MGSTSDIRKGAILTARTFIAPDTLREWRRDGNAGSGGFVQGAKFEVVDVLSFDPTSRGKLLMIASTSVSPPRSFVYGVPEKDLAIFFSF